MRSGVRVGRLFGIDIIIDWSWLLIFFLVTWSLAAGFADLQPEWGSVLRWGTAVAASLLFFLSVLAHELAHSLAARAQGLPVRSITLFLFGGVANIQRDPPSPRAEFIVAIVGPVTSILLGLLFLALARGLAGPIERAVSNPEQLMAGLDPLTTLLLWLGPINIILGLFNLLPGFPLDGGRLLRSILWAATDNLQRATRWASWVGQAFAWLLILAGISMIFGARLPFFGSGIINGLWLAFIGWFLNSAAAQSYQQVVIQDLLEGVEVSRLMRSDVPTVPAPVTIDRLIDEYVMGTDERAFPVMEGEEMVGLVTLEDIRRVPRAQRETTTAAEIMTPIGQLDVVDPHEETSEALNKLSLRDVRQVPVIENGRLVGMVRRRDIVRWLQLHSESAGG